MTHLAQLLKHLKGKGSQQTVTEKLNFTSKNLIQTHQRLDFPNALEKVRLRFCHLVLMNLYLGGFQCVHSFSKHRRKYASHVSEKRKRILSLTIVDSRCAAGPDLLPLCFDWVSRSCQHTFKSKSFSVAFLFGSSSNQNQIYQEGILRLIIKIFQKVWRKWLMHL